MDSLTQIVLGASVGELVLGKKAGNKALLWGAVAGTIPDLDVLSRSFTDIVTAHEWHRGVTHSILFCVLSAPLFGYLVKKFERLFLSVFFICLMGVFYLPRQGLNEKFLVLSALGALFFLAYKLKPNSKDLTILDWSKLMFWSLVTHPLLDAHTTWGTQLFWPFDLRIAYQNIFVADPFYTIPFLICTALVMFFKRTDNRRRMWNKAGLIISSFYMLLTIVFKYITYVQFDKDLNSKGVQYINIDTKPTPLNSILWTANVETKEGYYVGYYSLFDENNNINWGYYLKNHNLLGDLSKHDKIKRMIGIANGNFIITQKQGELYFNDLRFGQSGLDAMNDEFIFQYRLVQKNGELEIKEVERTFKEGENILLRLWNRIKGDGS